MPTVSIAGPVQTFINNPNVTPTTKALTPLQPLPNNRLSYIGSTSNNSSNLIPIVHPQLSPEGLGSTQEKSEYFNMNKHSNRDSSIKSCSNGSVQTRPGALVSSYISSLNSSVSPLKIRNTLVCLILFAVVVSNVLYV